MKNIVLALAILLILFGCKQTNEVSQPDISSITISIDSLLSNWHKNAAEANLDEYFGLMDSSFIYVGTDANEYWTKNEFKDFCEPYFIKGRTWDFKALKRNISASNNGDIVWFYEILNTHMGTCRGSGVFEKAENKWLLKQYVLSVAIPNEDMDSVKVVKFKNDSIYLNTYEI